MKTGTSRRRWCWRSTRRRSSASAPPAASSSTSRTAATAAPSAWRSVAGLPQGPRKRIRCSAAPRRCGAPPCRSCFVDVDREKAKALGVPVDEVFNTLSATLGSYLRQRLQQVRPHLAGADVGRAGFRKRPDDIGASWVRSANGRDGAVSALATVRYSSGPEIARPLQQPARGEADRPGGAGCQLGPGDRRGRADRARCCRRTSASTGAGTSYQEKRSSGTSVARAGLGALMVFLILAAQYEKWSLPLSVLLALPFGTFGALAAVWLRGMTNDVYFQIGLVTLLGLAAKNAILIVEFASLKVHEGMSASAAALEAARLRFRPIIMTSLAFILGVLPLAFSTGAGAARGARSARA